MRHIVIGDRGFIDAADHRQVLADGNDIHHRSVVRFYFDDDTYVDIKFDGCALQVRVMSVSSPSLAVVPQSGNTILVVPGD